MLETAMEERTAPEEVSEAAGMYLTLSLGEEVYGIEILKVQEIIGMMKVTRVPRTPDYVRGVVNLRGKVIPVMALRKRFGLDAQEDTDHTCIIVVNVKVNGEAMTAGLIVDEVCEVVDIAPEEVEATPSFGTAVDTSFMLGVGKTAERVVMLLDVAKVLSISEWSLVSQVGDSQQ